MRGTIAFASSLLVAAQVDAFATLNLASAAKLAPDRVVRRQNPSATPTFNAKAQYVSTSGIHAVHISIPIEQATSKADRVKVQSSWPT